MLQKEQKDNTNHQNPIMIIHPLKAIWILQPRSDFMKLKFV